MEITQRIKSLEDEFASGQKLLMQIDERRREVRDTLLRISGAIQVLRELSTGKADGMPSLSSGLTSD